MARYPYVKPEVTPEMQAQRDRAQADPMFRVNAGAKYYPAKVTVYPPVLPDGRLDVRAWLRQLDDACNSAVLPC